MGLGTIDHVSQKPKPFAVKESANPHFKTSDAEFIRTVKIAENMEQMAKAINANNENLSKVIAEIRADIIDLQNRVAKMEIFYESVVKPSHRREERTREKLKEAKKEHVVKQPVEIPQDAEMAERIAEIEKRAKERGVLR